MESILNAGLGIGAFMFLLLLFKKNKSQGDYFFLGWILITLGQIGFYEITIYRFEIHGFWAIPFFALPLLGAPMLFLYIVSLTGHRISWKTITPHLSVYLIYIVAFFVLKQLYDLSLIAVNGYFLVAEDQPLWMQYYAIPLAISGLVYCIWDLVLLRNHRKTIVAFFSFDEKINLKWVGYIVYSYFILFVLASSLIFGATQFQIFPVENAFALVGITLSLMLVAFGFYGFRQTSIFSNMDVATVSASTQKNKTEIASYSKSGLNQEMIEEFANSLSQHMESEKPFLNEDLSLQMLSEQCELKQAHLSQVINQHYKMNFYDFVNRYRIEEAKKRLHSPAFDHLSVLGIAFDCGFKSKSSFNRYFKKYTGVPPSEFKKKSTE